MDLKGSRVGRCGLYASGSGLGPVAGFCERDNELLGPIRGGELVDWLSDC
jgi:hypothetical protein